MSFKVLACLVAHAPYQPDFLASDANEVSEYQLTDRIPGWDDWLNDNSINAYMATATTGRVRGQAWGVSNPFTNFRSVVGGQFRFEYVLNPADVLFPEERYRFSLDIETDGRFLHTPAVPRPADEREPPARTFSQMDILLSVFQLLPGGTSQAIAADLRQQDLFRMLDASQFLEETINTRRTVSQDFFPRGQNPIVFRIVRSVFAAATGEYSDIRIRGSEGRRNFRVRVSNPRVQRVLEPSDPCFAVLNPPFQIINQKFSEVGR
ncbi:hypothetical protein BQ8794_170085 [Mesorhizobium prunaredense]|uniref:Uncharacterized protein n=1 Tax=Mesorhizobium prunaredense TaxID=1631249 RepID=A0A1R3V3U9_9HYPH|nr:hypothetical protein [Mesorhizobium prunaredense]SIT54592.1 hypothetical protein BQ8794_170085 [Mesorhizobium prunaredense]